LISNEDTNNALKRTAKDSLIYMPSTILPAVLGVIMLRVFTTLFSREEYGHYNLVLSTLGLMKVFSIVWLSASAIRFYQKYKKEEKLQSFTSTLFYAVVASSIVVGVIVYLLNYFVLQNKLDPQLFSIINIAIVASIVVAIFEVFVLLFRADLRPQKYTTFWIFYVLGKPLFALVLIFGFGMRVSAIFWGFLVIPFILLFFVFKHVKDMKFRPGKISKEYFSHFAKFGFPIAFTSLSTWFLSMFDRYLLEIYKGSSDVGLYAVGYSISEKTLQFGFMTLMLAAYPIIVDNWEKKGAEATQQLISGMSRYYMILLTPVLVVLVLIPKDIFLIFADSSFLPGAKVLPFIAGGFYLLGLSQYILKGFELQQKSMDIAKIALIAAVINVLSNILLIPKIGYFGASISSFIGYSVYFTVSVVLSKNVLRWSIALKTVCRVLVAGILMGLLLILSNIFNFNPFVKMFSVVLFACFIYFLSLVLMREISRKEIIAGLNLLRRLVPINGK
jgi:O-antigen/teichoic acid export membrane protein